MNCDEIIDEKLMRYPMSADVFSTSSYILVVGGMGQGKTSWLTEMSTQVMKKSFTHMIVLMPRACRQSFKVDIFGKHESENPLDPTRSSLTIFDTINADILSQIEAFLDQATEYGSHTLLLIDDFQSKYKNVDIALQLGAIIERIRHFRCTVIMLAQNYSKVPKNLREICQNLVIFNVGKSQMEKVYIDQIKTMNRQTFDLLVGTMYENPHDWLLFNFNKSLKIYRNWDEVVIS